MRLTGRGSPTPGLDLGVLWFNPGILSRVCQTQVKWGLFTLNYGSGSRRDVNSSSCFCVISNRCDCGHPRSSIFCKGASSSRLGSRTPDDSISMRWWGAHNPAIWFIGAEPAKIWNSLRACFYGCVSSIQMEKLFTPTVFF